MRSDLDRWFTHRGVPHLIEGYNLAEDVFTRAMPALVLVFLIELALAFNADWAWWANVLAAFGGLGLLVGGWAGLNRLRGRPPTALPDDVGPWEVAAFVLLPALLPLVINGHVREAAGVVAGNLVLLTVVFVVTSFGLVPMAAWALRRAARTLGSTVRLLGRSLPLLLVAFLFLFYSAEPWQVTASAPLARLVVAVALLAVLGILFLALRTTDELDGLCRFTTWADVEQAAATAPVPSRPVTPSEEPAEAALGRGARLNLQLLLLVGQGVPILVVAALVGAFFVVLGLLTITPETTRAWTGGVHDLGPAVTVAGLGTVQLSEELLRMSGFLGGFAGLYLAVSAQTDEVYRDQFVADVSDEVRTSIAAHLLAAGA